MMKYDVIVVGGGTSGMMAAISAAEQGSRVLLLEKNKTCGKKLLATGGGRCNVTNKRPVKDMIAHIPGNGKFLYSACSEFDNYDIIHFFESRGVALKEEDHGRMFPTTNSSMTILQCLLQEMKRLHVDIYVEANVKTIHKKNGQITSIEIDDSRVDETTHIILTTGGKASPHLGSTGDGYVWAKKVGHTITPLYPTEVAIVSKDEFIQNSSLMGLSFSDVALSVWNEKNKVIITHEMDMIFTHFGISGPAALRCAMFVLTQMKRSSTREVVMSLDIFPRMTKSKLQEDLLSLQERQGDKSVKNALRTLIPERYLIFLLKSLHIEEGVPYRQIDIKHVGQIADFLKCFKFHVHGTLPLQQAFVTGGGVFIKEIYPKTMESKLVKGLYFAGEIIDINGYTGGFNITAAFITGRIAGLYAGRKN